MAEDLDAPPAPAGASTPPEVQDAALGELQRRHRVVAEEYMRLTAILQAAGRQPLELDATTDLSAVSALARYPRDVATADGWERTSQGPLQRRGDPSPEPQRVVHLGTERNAPQRSTGRALAIGASSAGIGAVVAVALVLLLTGRGAEPSTSENALIAPGPETVAPQVVETEQALPAAPLPVQPSSVSPALDAVIDQARTAAGMDEGTAALVRRLPGLADLSGEARAEEAADIYGIAVTEARDDASGIATSIVEALEPEVELNGVIALATRRPEVVGPGMQPLLEDLNELPTLPADQQQAHAQEIIDAVAAGVMAETISGPYCNSIAHVLMPYGITMPA